MRSNAARIVGPGAIGCIVLSTAVSRSLSDLGCLTSENRPQRGQFLPDLQAHSPAMGQNEVSVKTNLYSSYVGTKKTVKNGPLRSICSRRSLSPTGS